MKIQEKPDYLIFADSAKKGENAEFPDVSRGWGITVEQTASKPPMEWMNGAFNRVDKNILYLLQQGVPEWSEKVTYPVNAIIKYNGVLYTAIDESDNAIPSTNTTKWKKTQAEIPIASTNQKGIVKLNSATNSDSETEAATPLAVNKVGGWAVVANNTATYALNTANAAVKRSGDNMTGELYINGEQVLTKRSYGIGVSKTLGETSIDADENRYSGFLFSQQQTQGSKPFNFCHVIRSVVSDSIADIAIDILSKRAAFRGVITDRNNANHNGDYSWAEFITSANLNSYLYSYLPVGIPLPWPQATPPAGWFECNGSPFNKSWYPKLAVAYPWGSLPDLRGEFIRGWDNGRNVDPGRGILSWQNDAIRNIYAEVMTAADPIYSSGAFYTESRSDARINSSMAGGNQTIIFDASRVTPTSHDNHPRNIAFMFIVKAE